MGLSVEGHHFVSYAGDAVIVCDPTGSTAYNFSAGGPIVAPSVRGCSHPSSPHSVFNRSVMIDHRHTLTLGNPDRRGGSRLRSMALLRHR